MGTKVPPDDVLESLYKLRIRESDQLKTVVELYDMEIHQRISMPNYQKLKTMVKRSIDRKLRLRSFDARNERIETGAVVTSRKGQKGVERGKGREETNAVSRTTGMNVQNRHQEPLHPLSHQHQEVEVRREHKSFRGRGPSGKTNRVSSAKTS